MAVVPERPAAPSASRMSAIASPARWIGVVDRSRRLVVPAGRSSSRPTSRTLQPRVSSASSSVVSIRSSRRDASAGVAGSPQAALPESPSAISGSASPGPRLAQVAGNRRAVRAVAMAASTVLATPARTSRPVHDRASLASALAAPASSAKRSLSPSSETAMASRDTIATPVVARPRRMEAMSSSVSRHSPALSRVTTSEGQRSRAWPAVIPVSTPAAVASTDGTVTSAVSPSPDSSTVGRPASAGSCRRANWIPRRGKTRQSRRIGAGSLLVSAGKLEQMF